jgi:FkbM family methyltransferase
MLIRQLRKAQCAIEREIEKLARRFGAYLYTRGSLPTGVDWLLDVQRDANRSGAAPRTVFDVGANIGQTVLGIRKAFPEARIFAFEPFLETFQTLRANTAGVSGAECFQLALGSRRDSLQVPRQGNTLLNSLLPATWTHHDKSSSETITVETLDFFCGSQNISSIDVLKIDTEGFELEVLRGGAELLSVGAIRFIYAELNFSSEDTRHVTFFALYEFLRSENFRFLGLYDTSPLHYYPEEIAFCNALFVNTRWEETHGRTAP